MIDLQVILEEYKNLTLILIEKVKKDEELLEEIDKRNGILTKLKELNCDEEKLKGIMKEYNIEKLDDELVLTIKRQMVKIKKQIENMRAAKKARKMYRVGTQLEVQLFQKKI